jgi:peptide/nickel transport system substrate-binding protein
MIFIYSKIKHCKSRALRIAAIALLSAVCACCAVFLSACDTGVGGILGVGGAERSENATVVSPVVFLPMESVRTLNPVLSKDEDSYYISKLIYDSLFEIDADLSVSPSLAESYAYDEDGLSLNIRLKSGLRWSDGESLDASDVVFSIEAYIANAGAHLYDANIRNIRNARVSSDDPLLLIISFKEIENTGAELLTFPILPSHPYRNMSELRRNVEDFIPVGTGLYIVQEFDRYSHLRLVGNPNRYGGDIPQNTLEFQIIPAQSDALNMLDVNAVSYAVSKAGDRDTIYHDSNMRVQSFPANEAIWIGFNFNKELFGKREARQAVAMSIDNEELLAVCFFNSGIPADCIYYPGFLGVGERLDPYAADPDAVKALLNAAGLSDANEDGFYEYFAITEEDETGQWLSLSLKFLVNEDDASRVAAGQMIQASLNRVGLACELVVLGGDSYMTALSEGDYDMYMGGGRLSRNYDLRPLLHSGYGNPIAYADPELDALLDSFTAAKSPLDRRSIFADIHARLVRDIPYYCLFYKTYGAVASPALVGEISPHFDNIYKGCENWQCVYSVAPPE